MTDTTSLRFAIDAKALASALQMVSALIHRSVSIPALATVLLQVEGEALRLTTTDLDSFLTVNLGPVTDAADGVVQVDCKALASVAKGLAKEKGAQVLVWSDPADGVLRLDSGRARQSLPLCMVPLPTWRDLGEPSELWTIPPGSALDDVRVEGLQVIADAKLLAKVRAFAGAEAEFAALRFDGAEGAPVRFLLNASAVTLGTKAAKPSPSWRAATKASPFQAVLDSEAMRTADRYLRALRSSHGLPAEVAGHGGGLVCQGGIAKGLTVGATYWASSKWSEPFVWTPPADVEVTGGRCEVAGVEFRNMRESVGPGFDSTGTLWQRYERAEIEGSRYPDGAYSVAMPRHAAERMVSADFVETEEGERLPLLLKSGRHECHLSAEEVRALCGPVDPSAFVAIPNLVIHGREIIARDGVDANGLRYIPASAPTVQDGKRRRKMTDREQLQAYNADPVGFTASLRPSWFAPADARQADVAPAVAERAPEAEAAPILPEPVALEVAAPAAPVAIAAELGIAERLAKLEALLGVASPAAVGKRTPAHAAAIRRAWRTRCEARARADLDRRALLQANGINRTLSEAMQQQGERIRRLEAVASQAQAKAAKEYAGERGELVDRLQQALEDRRERDRAAFAAAARADRQTARAARLARRAAGMRRDLQRARVERDGIAHNLAVMSGRVASDSAELERLRSSAPQVIATDRPRFIMATR